MPAAETRGTGRERRAVSSVGRASRLHREGRRFEPVTAHHQIRLHANPLLLATAARGEAFRWRNVEESCARANGLRAIGIAAATLIAALVPVQAPADGESWVVRPEWVKAHEDFLASPALQGRGSATRDEAIAAAYVAAEFEKFGLKTAPGMTGYTQVAHVIRPRLSGTASLTIAARALPSLKLLIGGDQISRKIRADAVIRPGSNARCGHRCRDQSASIRPGLDWCGAVQGREAVDRSGKRRLAALGGDARTNARPPFLPRRRHAARSDGCCKVCRRTTLLRSQQMPAATWS